MPQQNVLETKAEIWAGKCHK